MKSFNIITVQFIRSGEKLGDSECIQSLKRSLPGSDVKDLKTDNDKYLKERTAGPTFNYTLSFILDLSLEVKCFWCLENFLAFYQEISINNITNLSDKKL